MNDYYVYVYIDPRNFEEFYYGKGRGSRKEAHLEDESDTPKVRRIREIHDAGTKPIIRVIASGLAEHDALMIEATLLWKLGKYTTNLVSGHFTGNFRPHNSFHRELVGFDFDKGLYHFNTSHDSHGTWIEWRTHGFISAGGGERYRDLINELKPGDIIAAYQSGHGYVGVGIVKNHARIAAEVTIGGESLMTLAPSMMKNPKDAANADYVATVDWIKTFESSEAKRYKDMHVFRGTKASLENQSKTMEFLETNFGVNFADLLR